MITWLYVFLIDLTGKITWEWWTKLRTGRKYELTYQDHQEIMKVLKEQNVLILTRRSNHLSTYACNLSHWLLTGRWGYWSHACVNVDLGATMDRSEVQIIEAIGSGVQVSPFEKVFNCQSAIFLRPLMKDGLDYQPAVEQAIQSIGLPYDDFFNADKADAMSCVEVLKWMLQKIDGHQWRFHGFWAMIHNEKRLTPDMFVECGSFETVLEIRR